MLKRHKPLRLAAGEIELLEILWTHQAVTLAQAHELHPRKIGYTTIQTRLNRLVEKKLVRKRGSHPACYEAVIQPEEASRRDLDALIRHVTQGDVVPLVAHLVKDRKLTPNEIHELKQLIDDAERLNRKAARSKES